MANKKNNFPKIDDALFSEGTLNLSELRCVIGGKETAFTAGVTATKTGSQGIDSDDSYSDM